ncbi:hypothetical protein I551_3314 [Mycobacterium ulcerans str. Harvey]|uniref:Uncharacterized protein n=1 Tax=Mycobacterium ulcerans str. Harvey TaxID=1299332 RepID=A0ABP3AG40_MYCUL|nr:hypothetical protein I551_3314 [Mycobacterium ulcerans str. Harvey]
MVASLVGWQSAPTDRLGPRYLALSAAAEHIWGIVRADDMGFSFGIEPGPVKVSVFGRAAAHD